MTANVSDSWVKQYFEGGINILLVILQDKNNCQFYEISAVYDDDSFCLTSLLISVMMSDSSHCQNRTIYKLSYRYGAVGSIV